VLPSMGPLTGPSCVVDHRAELTGAGFLKPPYRLAQRSLTYPQEI
jgi:hypothetical protein